MSSPRPPVPEQSLREAGRSGPRDDIPTLAAIGLSAAMLAALAHEAIGHGGACLASGGEITLLSVIWFGCSINGPVIDLAGPAAGLLAGLGGFMLAARSPLSALRARLFGLMLGSFAVFWFSAQLATQGLSGLDDWRVATTWLAGWRVAAMAAGVVIYGAAVFVTWSLASKIGRGQQVGPRFLVPYVAGALALVLCAALRWTDGSAWETVRAVGIAPLGFVWAVTRRSAGHADGSHVRRSWGWIVVGLAGFTLYTLIFGPGVGTTA